MGDDYDPGVTFPSADLGVALIVLIGGASILAIALWGPHALTSRLTLSRRTTVILGVTGMVVGLLVGIVWLLQGAHVPAGA
jgi:hypothetical protein